LKEGKKFRKVTLRGIDGKSMTGFRDGWTICDRQHVEIPEEEYCHWIYVCVPAKLLPF
jgi:hypothetical protein